MDEKIIFSDSNKDRLIKVLTEISETTVVDSFLRNQDKVMLEITKNGNWRVIKDIELMNSDLNHRGSNFNSLVRKLDDMYEKLDVSFDQEITLTVLAYAETMPTRTWDGKIQTKWFEIDPSEPYTYVDGSLNIQTRSIDLNDSDYKLMMQCKLALATSKKVYPFLLSSLKSIGRYLDCEYAFKKVDEYQLGSAILIANKLSYLRQIQILAYKRKGDIWPLRTICGKKYVYVSQLDFFQDVFNECAKLGVFKVDSWYISDDMSRVYISFTGTDRGLLAITSDTSSATLQIRAYEKINSAKVLVDIRKSKHTEDYLNQGIQKLFSSLLDTYECFEAKMEKLKGLYVSYSLDEIKDIQRILGKKRCKGMNILPCAMKNGYEAFVELINLTYQELPVKQELELQSAYAALLDKLSLGGMDKDEKCMA